MAVLRYEEGIGEINSTYLVLILGGKYGVRSALKIKKEKKLKSELYVFP